MTNPASYCETNRPPWRRWLAAALVLPVLAAGGLAVVVAAAPTASAQTGTLDADECAAGGTWVVAATDTGLEQDCRALVAAHNAWIAAGTDDTNTRLGTWGTGAITDWEGISVGEPIVRDARDPQDRVIAVENPHFRPGVNGAASDLPSGGLAAELCDLDALQELEFTGTGRSWDSDTVPACFNAADTLPNLMRIHIFQTEIQGTLGTNWCAKTRLTVLHIVGSSLSGALPSCLGQNVGNQALTIVRLSDGDFTGSIPAMLGSSTSLQSLWLHDNQLSGELPGGFINLRTLRVDGNNLSGPLPSNFAAGGHLTRLRANDMGFTGPIPAAWTQPGSGRIDRVSEFNLADNNLSGVLDVDWIDAISILNISRFEGFGLPPNVSLEGNQLCFADPHRTVDEVQRVEIEANERLIVPNFAGFENPTWLTPPRADRPRTAAIFSLANQRCSGAGYSVSNLTMRHFPATSVAVEPAAGGNPARLVVDWETIESPATGMPLDVSIYEITVTGPGGADVSSHFPNITTGAGSLYNAMENEARNFPSYSDHYQSGYGATVLAGADSGARLDFSTPTPLPAADYEVTVRPWFLAGVSSEADVIAALRPTGFLALFPWSDLAETRLQVLNVVDSTEPTALAVLEELGVTEIYEYGITAPVRDAVNPAWKVHSDTSDVLGTEDPMEREMRCNAVFENSICTTQLPFGAGLLFELGEELGPARLLTAGVGRLEDGVNFRLYPGWNLISPSISLVGELSSDTNPALFWHEDLWNCDLRNPRLNHAGTAVILAYNSYSTDWRWRVHLTCGADGALDSNTVLNELHNSDIVFVYFNVDANDAPCGVEVTWDVDSKSYMRTSSSPPTDCRGTEGT